MNLLDCIKTEHLTNEQKDVASIIGIEAYKRLIDSYGGEKLYIPKLESIVKKNRDELIRDNYTGENALEIREKFGITIREIDRIAHGCR